MVFYLVYYFVGKDAYLTLFILKSFNGIWNIYYLFNSHLVYRSSIRRLLVCLSALFTTLNFNALFCLIFYKANLIKLDPIILTMVPGLFFIKLCILKLDSRIFDLSYNVKRKFKRVKSVNIILY